MNGWHYIASAVQVEPGWCRDYGASAALIGTILNRCTLPQNNIQMTTVIIVDEAMVGWSVLGRRGYWFK